MSIITSLLDTDYYKFSQMQFVFHRFPDVEVEYTFKCRNRVDLLTIAWRIEEEIKALCGLKFASDEIEFQRQQGVFEEDYLEFLKDFRLDYNRIDMPIGREFELRIKGKWLDTILFETPILAIISELYSRSVVDLSNRDVMEGDSPLFIYGDRFLRDLGACLGKTEIAFADFGTRRRFSRAWQSFLLERIEQLSSSYWPLPWLEDEGSIPVLQERLFNFTGTSNVMFAKRYNIKPVGTQAHEIFAAGQRLAPSLRQSQKFILQQWLDEYKGKLGIALTDIIGMDAFLRDFDYNLASAYQGCRHDSGDPCVWGSKLIAHYKKLDIDPMSKTAVFSDGLTFDSMVSIHRHFKGRINVVFGIGTNLTNNVGIIPANIVIKLTEVNGQPVAKISDSPGKGMCEDEAYVERLKKTFGVG